ncbi:NACHT domain-containing protein [Streptomyces sp. NPDC002659]|uniref:NACHT domain-containing protein n=1 Tax=Streptomyces sp. NPDC002659 TaxID=3364656 RepID=UPI0036B34F92
MSGLPTTPERVVAVVSGGRQGSGVILSPRLVLTCAHVLGDGAGAQVLHPTTGEHPCKTVWTDESLDVSLLQSATSLLRGKLRLGNVETAQALSGCEVLGFPDIQRFGPERHLDLDQFTGTVLPAAGALRRLLVCELDRPPAAERTDGSSPLAGLSGAPLFAGAVLLGITTQVPRGRRHQRLECTPLAEVLASEGFLQSYAPSTAPPIAEPVTELHRRDQQFERDYTESVGVAYRKTEIFGLDELNKRDSTWDLDTAYLSLEAQPKHKEGTMGGPSTVSRAPQRIDTLLASRPRVLIRGDAGAGKTTLVWWLAAHAAVGDLGQQLADLNGMVPFVVPLRTLRAHGGAFPAPSQLPTAAHLPVDEAPQGWVGRVLKAGRALLLVDGVDEVPQDDRAAAHRWLTDLLERFPRNRCVATVRPLAVESDWLKSDGFEELRLLPMGTEDIQAFVAAWHEAARLDCEALEDIDALERDLSRQLRQNPALIDLARTPLLCAVICALHRLRQGFLPDTRWKLYQAALDMLLGNRDKRRRLGAAEGIRMSIEESTELLQRIAVWLVREGQSEFSQEQAVRQLQRALPGMEGIRGQGAPEDVLKHLLNRSGLLQERAEDAFQFAHRTFQDFLAAKEFVEDGHLNELLRHASEQQWQDVILLASGHCGRRELSSLVHGLLDAGTREDSGAARAKTYVLAALCAHHAAYLDARTAGRMREHITGLLPPREPGLAPVLARLGPSVLNLLPSPEDGGDEVLSVIGLIFEIGGPEAVPHARAWAVAHPGARHEFAYAWSSFPAEAYAREVLSRIDLRGIGLAVETRSQLAQLHRLPDARRLIFRGDFEEAELRAALRGRAVVGLSLAENSELTDLSVLSDDADELQDLELAACDRLSDFSALYRLPLLHRLGLEVRTFNGTDLPSLQAIAGLRSLRLHRKVDMHLAFIPVHRGVTSLRIEAEDVSGFDRLDNWPSLTHLELLSPHTSINKALSYVRGRAGITRLGLTLGSAETLSAEAPLPAVRELTLWVGDRVGDLGVLRTIFPALAELDLIPPAAPSQEQDLRPLLGHPGLTVRLNGVPVPCGDV